MRPSKSEIEQLYNTEQLTAQEIGVRYGVSKRQSLRWMNFYGIKRRKACRIPIRPSKETLESLYLTRQLSQKQIANIYDVDRAVVSRWTTYYQIPTRFDCKGLKFRGLSQPSRERLFELVHVRHETEKSIGQRFDVSHTTIRKWLIKHGIPAPKSWTTRLGRELILPSEDDLRISLNNGQSLRQIARRYNVSPNMISRLCERLAIAKPLAGWSQIAQIGTDSHVLKSGYERLVCDWLTANNIFHSYEPKIPNSRYRADFQVRDTYIEIWGVQNPEYRARKQVKKALYKERGLSLLSIDYWHFTRDTWQQRLASLLPHT